jgi:hypothetical protein
MMQTYINNRTKYKQPQGLLLADQAGVAANGTFVPNGTEFEDFIILTDDNRDALDMSMERIEQRERMINGRMRSYHVADKTKISASWDMIPSRAFKDETAPFDGDGKKTAVPAADRYTTDGGAAGNEMLKWYDGHKGSFWVFLSYDRKYNANAAKTYNERLEMQFADFSYTVKNRGPLFDYWSVNISLEEV